MTDQDSTTVTGQTDQPDQTDPAQLDHAPSAAVAEAGGSSDDGPTTDQAQQPAREASSGAGATLPGTPADGTVAGPHGGTATSRASLLEREGEVAADFLEQLLDIADMDGDIDVDVDGDRAAVAIVDSEEGRVSRRLVGPDGKVLDALQELTRLAVQAATGERSRLMLDVAGHRAERRTALVELARRVITQVRTTGEQQAMDPMTAFERKVVHDEVAAAGLGSDSEGVEPHRHVVVLPE
jgi:spoIIIJ-associated protein